MIDRQTIQRVMDAADIVDVVKDIGGTDGRGIRYLSDIFQNGSISKEYLGNSSRSESTPLGTDMNIVLRQPRGKWRGLTTRWATQVLFGNSAVLKDVGEIRILKLITTLSAPSPGT